MTERKTACVVVAACATAVVTASCGSDYRPKTPPERVTFEALYVGADTTGVRRGAERLAALPEQLASQPVDVLCLQGIGDPDDRARLRAALVQTFPVSVDLATDDATPVDDARDAAGRMPPPETKAPCAGLESQLAGTLACFGQRPCAETIDGPIFDENCLLDLQGGCARDEVFAVADPERRCQSCILDHARVGTPLSEIRTRCHDVLHPLVLGGEHGMMILSKLPMSRAALRVLPAEETRRAVVAATVTTKRGVEIDVACASLGPTGPSALPSDPRYGPYAGPYGTPSDGWLRENELQVDQLVSFVSAHRETRASVVLGNFGASSGIVREGTVLAPPSGAVAARRLEEAFAVAVAPDREVSCTECVDNPLVAGLAPDSFENRIYLAGMPRAVVVASARSYLGGVISVQDAGSGATHRWPLSMQYGFRATIEVQEP